MALTVKRFILVVDNNVDDQFNTNMLLQQLDYNICPSRTAEEAIEFMSVAPPAAIIAEAVMANVLITRIRKDGRFSDVPLILLATTTDRGLEERVRRGEITAFLIKPVNVEELYKVLQTVVEKGQRRNIRITTVLPAKIDDGATEDEGYITTLSEYGMFFRTLDPRPIHSRLSASIVIKERTVNLEAIVLYSYAFIDGPFKEPGMGMKFSKISPEDQAFIKAFILEQVQSGMKQ